MAKVKGRVKATTRRKPVKAGSRDKSHGGFPTQKLIKIMTKIKVEKNG